MNSIKLKLIFTLIFLTINLFFAYKLINLNEAKNTFSQSEIYQAAAVLKNKGINIDAEDIINIKNVPYVLNISFDTETVKEIADEIMHGEYTEFNIPDGLNFTGNNESLSIYYDYTFEYKSINSDIDQATIQSLLLSASVPSQKDSKRIQKTFSSLLSAVSKNNLNTNVKIDKILIEDGITYISGTELIGNYEIANSVFYIAAEGEKILFASGGFYFTDQVNKYSTDAYDSINILFGIEKQSSKIEKMELIYFPVAENSSSYYLVPSYKFTLSDGTQFTVDATSAAQR